MSGPTTRGLPVLCSTGDVAAALGWDVDTIRSHLVEFREWMEMLPKQRSGKVPYVKLGDRYKVPRWWVEDAVVAMSRPGGKR